MKNRILDHIESVLLNQRRAAPERMSFDVSVNADLPALTDPVQYKKRFRLQVWFETWVSEGVAKPAEEAETAKRAIAHHLYGDTVDSLLWIREDMWSEGLSGDSEALKKMDALIAELQGHFTRFEAP